MYYVIETNYVGPNQDQNCDADTVGIFTAPARTNMSNEVMIDGWCGTSNDWSTYGRGEFETLEEARAAIDERYGAVREQDITDAIDDDLAELYAIGEFEPMSREQTGDWIYSGIREDIDADTSDERIAELADEYEAYANAETTDNQCGYTLTDAEELMLEYRQQLRDEREDDDDE